MLLPGLTAREMLSFAAQLSLPRNATRAERAERVGSVMRELHLSEEDGRTKIGSVDDRGLSGGQRKRVSIGIELLAQPAVLLVDEPTSGLDAKMAHSVVSILRRIAQSGKTVVATVHQPSARLFRQFDALLLSATARSSTAARRPTPRRTLRRSAFRRRRRRTPPSTCSRCSARAATTPRAPARPILRASGSTARRGDAQTEAAAAAAAKQTELPAPVRAVGPLRQFLVLSHRQLYDAVKDTKKLLKSLLMRSIVGVAVGVLFLGQGRSDSFGAIFPVTSTMFIAVLNSNLDTVLEGLLQGPPARALLRREYANGLYSCESYFGAVLVVNLVQATLSTVCLVVPLYLLVGFAPTALQAARFLACLVIMTVIGMSIGLAIGQLAKDIDEARVMLLPIIAPQMIFSGYVLPYGRMPDYFKWLYYASFWQYGLGVLQVNEFANRTYTEDCPAATAEQLLYDDLAHILEEANITLPPHVFNGTCNGTASLVQAGLWPVKFGGLQNYFLILIGYMLLFIGLAYAGLKWSLRARA